jgi:hypothetical protein
LDKFTTVDPFTLYQLVLIAGTLRAAVGTEGAWSKFSADRKNKIVFMLWAADAVILTMYQMWFRSGKFYRQAPRPAYSDDLAKDTLAVLRAEADVVIGVYLASFRDGPAFTQRAHDTALLSTRDVGVVTTHRVATLFRPADFVGEVASDKFPIVWGELVEDDADRFSQQAMRVKNAISGPVADKVLGAISKAEGPGVFSDPVLDKLVGCADTVRGTADKNELFIIKTIPFLSFIERMVNEKNVGNYFEFKEPGALEKGSNYEFILNETVQSGLTKYETMSNMF